MGNTIVAVCIVIVIVAYVVYQSWEGKPLPPPPSVELDPEQTKALLEKIAPIKRDAWIPVTQNGDGDLTASKFAGIPWLAEGEMWPTCPRCNKPMQLFLQLNLETAPALPEGCPNQGLLQFFYCTTVEDGKTMMGFTSCDVENEGWAPFSKNTVLRIVKPNGPGQSFDASPVEDTFPAKLITDWQRKDDYPGWGGDLADNNIDLTDDEFDWLGDQGYPTSGEKLLGWPYWIQSQEYPDCPECGERMHLLFQIDSDTNLPYMFGDVGCGHITQCPKHPHRLAFGWACS